MGRKEVIFINDIELKKIFDSIVEAIKKIFEAIKKVFNDIFDCYRRFKNSVQVGNEKNLKTSPREFGVSLFTRRRKEPKYVAYRCVKKIQRNLPYQRRLY